MTLPEKIRGQYSLISDFGIRVNIEGVDEKWILKTTKQVVIVDNKQEVDACEIKDMSIYNVKSENLMKNVSCLLNRVQMTELNLKKYLFKNDVSLDIGRKSNNSIVINNNYVSSNHAKLTFKNGKWSIVDNDSSNGTFVNGRRVKSSSLNFGDVIYIMGTIIIVGNSMVAINNPDNSVNVNTSLLISYVPQKADSADDDFDFDDVEEEFFYRSPRFKRDIETAVFKIDAPPQNQLGEEMPIMMAIGPSMTMGMALMATAVYGVMQGNFMSAVTSGFMLLGTVLWPIISKKYEKEKNTERKFETRKI